MKKYLLALMLVLCMAVSSQATVGSCVTTIGTSTTTNDRVPDSVTVIVTLTCTGGTGGDAGTISNTTIPIAPSTTGTLTGYNLYGYYLFAVKRIPGNVSSSQLTCSVGCPTASYTVTITDADGFAIDLGDLTSNGSASVAQYTNIYTSSVIYPVITSAPIVAISGNSVASSKITLRLVFKAW